MIQVPSCLVDAVWRSVRNGPCVVRPYAGALFASRFAREDLVPCYCIYDLVDDLGFRDLAHAHSLLAAFEVESVTMFMRPRSKTKMCIGGTYVTLADAAALLIQLERAGLAIDPEPLVAAVRPSLSSKSQLRKSELRCWWFQKERHKCESFDLAANDKDGFTACEEFKTNGGYRAEAWLDADGRAVQLWVRAPKYRRSRRMAA